MSSRIARGKDDAHHTEGIGAGVTVGDGGDGAGLDEVGQNTVGRTETGSIGHSAIHHPDHHGQVVGITGMREDTGKVAQIVEAEHDHHVEHHQTGSEQVHAQSARLEGFEETGADLQTDAVDKEDESQLLDHIDDGFLIGHGRRGVGIKHVGADVADNDAHKEHPRDSEGNAVAAANLPATQFNPQTNDQGIQNHNMRNALRVL